MFITLLLTELAWITCITNIANPGMIYFLQIHFLYHLKAYYVMILCIIQNVLMILQFQEFDLLDKTIYRIFNNLSNTTVATLGAGFAYYSGETSKVRNHHCPSSLFLILFSIKKYLCFLSSQTNRLISDRTIGRQISRFLISF